MSTPVTTTTWAAFLKKYYIGKKALYQLDDYKTPLVGLLGKDLGAGGSTWEQTVAVSNVVGGTNGAYTTAYANSTAGTDVVFSGNYKKRFADVKIQDSVIRQSNSKDGAIEKVMKAKIDSLKSEFLQTINFQAYRSEGGAYCQLGIPTASLAVFNGTVAATEATRGGVQFIKPGMILNMGANLDGTSLESNAGTALQITVTGRNLQAGTFTYTAGSSNAHPSGSAYVFEDGSATNSLAGLRAWCPLTDTLAATTFKGVTRSTDVNALGGLRIAGVGLNIEEAINQAVTVSRQVGEDPDVILMHPLRYNQLQLELADRIRYNEVVGKPLVGGSNSFRFNGLQVSAGGRPVTVIEDGACQYEATWVIDSNKSFLRSCGQWPYTPSENGIMVQRVIGTDYWQSELFAILELVCAAPQSICAISHNASIA